MRFFAKLAIFTNVILFLYGLGWGQNSTNLELLTSVTDSLLESVVNEVADKLQDRIKIKALTPNAKINWFVESRLSIIFQKKKIETFFIDSGGALKEEKGPASVFEFQILNIEMQYFPTNGLVSGSLKRVALINFFLRVLQEPFGEVLWSGELSAQKNDSVSAENLESLENPNIPFTKGKLSEPPEHDRKLLQTLLISGVTGAIVYLLYALRSR